MGTLEKITSMGRSRTEVNEDRTRQGLSESAYSSFFECYTKVVDVPRGAVTWSDKPIDVWVYTRVGGTEDEHNSVFLCSNRKCLGNHYTSVIQSSDSTTNDSSERKNIALL